MCHAFHGQSLNAIATCRARLSTGYEAALVEAVLDVVVLELLVLGVVLDEPLDDEELADVDDVEGLSVL